MDLSFALTVISSLVLIGVGGRTVSKYILKTVRQSVNWFHLAQDRGKLAFVMR